MGVVPDPLACKLCGEEEINGFDRRGSTATVLRLWLIRSKHAGQKDS